VKVSELERLTGVDSKSARLARDAAKSTALLDQVMFGGKRDAARFSSIIDKSAVSAAHLMFRDLRAANLIQLDKMNATARALSLTQPIVDPGVSEMVAKSLDPARFGLLAGLDTDRIFGFAKALEGIDITAALRPRLAEAFGPLGLSEAFRKSIFTALGETPRWTQLVVPTAEAVASAAELAGTETVDEVVEDTIAGIAELSPAERRQLAIDIAHAIATFGALAAIFVKDGRLQAACATISLLAILVSIYWRVTGKLR
jgi:hypothetical protein